MLQEALFRFTVFLILMDIIQFYFKGSLCKSRHFKQDSPNSLPVVEDISILTEHTFIMPSI